jgi:hypothetical protein
MAALLDDFLTSAQRFLYTKSSALQTERIFSWTMTAGTRYYDIASNDEQTSGAEFCTKILSEFKAPSWVGMEDLNGVWAPLNEGIDPTRYTTEAQRGYPDSYEIRQGIEVFPAPADAYILRVKGHFGLMAFVADDDTTTLDSELVFTLALGNAKNHYGQPDGRALLSQVATYLGSLTANSHGTARYIPRAEENRIPVQPKMTTFIP